MSFILSGILLTYAVAVLFLHGVRAFILGKSTECYGDLGCFSTSGPFQRSFSRPLISTPASPDVIRTHYILFTRENSKDGQTLDARKPGHAKATWTKFKSRPTKLIVHGFLDDISFVTWLHEMKDELLTLGDYNTIIVDWHHGNTGPYTQATANTRVVGAQIAKLIKQLQKDFGMSASQFHIIGHSLGSHIAGYAGERIMGLGRITGLDPAGPMFIGTDKVVRLDPTDADFVDTIHSDAKEITKGGFGIRQPLGHSDFYPNLGYHQPGCQRTPLNLIRILYTGGVTETVACNHLRSIRFFTESINTKCPFLAFACDSVEDFENNKCHTCVDGSCSHMGFRADENKPSPGKYVKYYTSTGAHAPFCRYQVGVRIKLSDSSTATNERGTIQVRLHDKQGPSAWISLDKTPVEYYPGATYERHIAVPHNFQDLTSVDFKWHHESELTNPFKWNILGLRKPTLHLKEIDIIREEYGKELRFCEDDLIVDNDKANTFTHKCTKKRSVSL